MRLLCTVDVCNRLLPSFDIKQKGRSTKSLISIGRKPGCTSGHLFLLICSKTDRLGNSFQINQNVHKYFTRFVNDGKATVRFIEPPSDVCISKADPLQLKNFLSVLKMVVQGESLENIRLSPLGPVSAKQFENLKTKLTVVKKNDYPITKGFPPSLEYLAVHNCSLKKIDARILRLRQLTFLNLSSNCIKVLPDCFDQLESLSQLILTDNLIEDIPSSFCRGPLTVKLMTLDVSYNKLTFIKPYFCDLKGIKDLKLGNNQIKYLPLQLGNLVNLRQLSIVNNNLKTLPASFSQLHLESLDLFNNEFLEEGPSTVINRLEFPSLLELSARTIVQKRVSFKEDDVRHMKCYLDSVKYCLCGSPCFRCHVHYLSSLHLPKVASSVTAVDKSGRMHAPCEAFLCSSKCLAKYQKNPSATIW